MTNVAIAAGRQAEVGRLTSALESIDERLEEILGALVTYEGNESDDWHDIVSDAVTYAEGLAGALRDMREAS